MPSSKMVSMGARRYFPVPLPSPQALHQSTLCRQAEVGCGSPPARKPPQLPQAQSRT